MSRMPLRYPRASVFLIAFSFRDAFAHYTIFPAPVSTGFSGIGRYAMKYKNYVFDLYGTLVDIRTDESRPALWRALAGLYAACGADYTPAALRVAFLREEKKARRALGKKLGTPWPEIRLEKIFAQLLASPPRSHGVSSPVSPSCGTEEILQSGWAALIANCFRVLSRDKMHLYPGTKAALSGLREAGCGVYLLSNAQAVFTRPEIEALGLEAFFDGVFLSSDLMRMKPDPVFMEMLLQKYGLDKRETVMVGNDFFSDAGVALASGMDCVILNTGRRSRRELSELTDEALRKYPGAARDSLVSVPSAAFLP